MSYEEYAQRLRDIKNAVKRGFMTISEGRREIERIKYLRDSTQK